VGWLELFYDLIYVATIIQLGNSLSHHVSIAGFLAFFGLFVPIWYTWTGFTNYSNRFLVDDALHRGLVFIQMFAIGAMAVSVPQVMEHNYSAFAGSYAVARWVLVALYFRTWKQADEAQEVTRIYWRGFGVGAVHWSIAPFVSEPWVYVIWVIAMVVDVATPLSRADRHLPAGPAAHDRALWPADHHRSRRRLREDPGQRRRSRRGPGSGPDHHGQPGRRGDLLSLVVGFTAVGVAVKKVVFFDPGEIAPAKYRWLLCGSLALALFAVAVIDYFTERREADLSHTARVNMRFGSAVLVLLLAPAGGFMSALAFSGLVSLACISQVLFDLWMAPQGLTAQDLHQHEAEEKAQLTARLALAREQIEPPESPEARKHRTTLAISQTVRLGAPNDMRRDMYYQLMEGGWNQLLVGVVLAYLFTNVIFASLFLLEVGGVNGLSGKGFIEAFSFSVQSLTTIGYGTLSPESPYAHTLVAVEALVGLLGVALVTGLVFAKASRHQSSVMFSE
jgi:hypothetical protein